MQKAEELNSKFQNDMAQLQKKGKEESKKIKE
jgi:hypothetical protein